MVCTLLACNGGDEANGRTTSASQSCRQPTPAGRPMGVPLCFRQGVAQNFFMSFAHFRWAGVISPGRGLGLGLCVFEPD